MNEKTTVWIVEDDEFLRESYMQIVNSSEDFAVTRSFRTGEEAVKEIAGHQPDLVLMDIELPGMSGVECTSTLISKCPTLLIVMVTVYEDTEVVFNSLKAGASGYVTKSSNYQQLLDSLHQIVAGGSPMSSKIARMVIESFHKNPASPLSKRESEVLTLVAEGKTFSQVSDQLFIARETSKTHIRNIYRKLGVNCRADAIAKANKDHLI